MFRTYTASAPDHRRNKGSDAAESRAEASTDGGARTSPLFKGTKVVTLAAQDFDVTRGDKKHGGFRARIRMFPERTSSIIMFYAPWCYYCTELKPDWVKLAEQVASRGMTGVQVCAVDCDDQPAVNGMFEIEGFPTIGRLAPDGSFSLYHGPRSLSALLEYAGTPEDANRGGEPAPAPASAMFGASNVVELQASNFDFRARKFVGTRAPLMVLFYAPWCRFCKDMKEEWERLAGQASAIGITVAALDCTQHTHVSTLLGVDGFPFIVLYKSSSFDDAAVYVGPRRADSFAKYARAQLGARPGAGNAAATNHGTAGTTYNSLNDNNSISRNNNDKKNINDDVDDAGSNMLDTRYARYVDTYDTQKVMHAAGQGDQGDDKGTLVMFFLRKCTASAHDRERLLPAAAYKFSKYLRVGVVDIDENKDLARRLCVDASPCYILFLKGQTYKFVGIRNKVGLYTFLADRLNGAYGSKTYIRFAGEAGGASRGAPPPPAAAAVAVAAAAAAGSADPALL